MMTAKQWASLQSSRQMVLWLGAALVVLLILAFALLCGAVDAANPRSIQYQLWKANVISLDRDTALRAFYIDVRRDNLILGKSEQELSARFGTLEMPEAVGPYYRDFAHDRRWQGKKIRYIKGTAWLISFDHDKAVDLLLVKG